MLLAAPSRQKGRARDVTYVLKYWSHTPEHFGWVNLFCFLLLKINRVGEKKKKVAECSQVVGLEKVAREAVPFYLLLI